MNYNVRNASDLILWLDGDDISTMLDDAGGSPVAHAAEVLEWQDKSGNAHHAQNLTGANRPQAIYSSFGMFAANFTPGVDSSSILRDRAKAPGLFFSSDFLRCGTALGDPSAYTIYLVFTPGATVSSTQVVCGGASSGSSANSWGMVANELWGTGGDGKISHTFGDGTLYRYEEATSQHLYSYHPTIYSVAKIAGVGASSILERGNLLSVTTGGTSAINATTSGSTFSLGEYSGLASSFFNGWIHEIIVCESAHSLMEQQEINGYLAYKYNFIARKGFVQVPKVVAKAGTSNLLKVNFPAITENRMEANLTGFAARIKTPDGSQADLSGSISDIGSGVYEFSLASGEVDAQGGGSIVIKHALCDDVFIPLEVDNGHAVLGGVAEDSWGETTIGGYIEKIKKYVANKITKSSGTYTIFKDDETTTYETGTTTPSERNPA